MDRLTALHTFVRIVDSGSISAVARELGLTQSAVSKALAALERQLGATLLTRTTRQLTLTEAGMQVLEMARRVVAEVQELESSLARGQQTLNGPLRIAASGAFGRLHLLPLISSFLAQHPNVQVDLRLQDGFTDLVEQGIDVAVRIGALTDSRLVARPVGVSRRCLVARRDYLTEPGRAPLRQPDDLASHACLVYTELQTRHAWTFQAGPGADAPLGEPRTVRVHGQLQSNSSEVIREAVLAGLGIAYAPDWLLHRELATGEVAVLLPAWQVPPLPVHLVSPPDRRQSPKVRAFVEHAAEALRQRLAPPE